jgi:hypothetical protein
MPKRLSTLFNITPQSLADKGVFNSFIDIDSKLYVDPSLLEFSKIPEMNGAFAKFKDHFENILLLINKCEQKRGMFWNELINKLTFKESPIIFLGYAGKGNHGNGIGKKLASKLREISYDLVKNGIQSPKIFELIGLIQEDIGPDRISDMTLNIIEPYLIEYTERICKELKINCQKYQYNNRSIMLPYNTYNKRHILLLPKDILRNIPIANDWSDYDIIYYANDEIKRKINKLIGTTWKEATYNKNKMILKRVLLKYPQLVQDLIDKYDHKIKKPYDFDIDPAGEVTWAKYTDTVASKFPLDLKYLTLNSPSDVFQIVIKICQKFKELIENNGWYEILYNPINKNDLLNERIPQKLLYGVAESYCEANNLDLTRESNGGIGPVDFKISRGYFAKVTIEVKYSSNPKLLDGYKKQLESYNRAEKSTNSIYLVIKTNSSNKKIEDLRKYRNEEVLHGKIMPEIIVIDGMWQKTASKR